MNKNYLIIFIILHFGVVVTGQNFVLNNQFANLSSIKNANGIAMADVDQDGDLDVYIVAKEAYNETDPSSWNRLFLNQGQQFIDVTFASGLSQDQYSQNKFLGEGIKMGASWGDYDNDGYPDLFLTNHGKDQLWHNKKDGTFENVSRQAGIEGQEERHSSSALWWDYDNDGDLDIYVSSWHGDNALYRNDGNTNFIDVSNQSGLKDIGSTWTSIPIDVNKDGLQDLYILNDFSPNFLFINASNDTFIDYTAHYGLGDLGNGMGVDICDYNNDGNFDIYLTNIEDVHPNPFFQNNGNTFDNTRRKVGFTDARWGWGARFFDMDHDMDEDLYVVNQSFFDGDLEYNRLFELEDDGTFKEKSALYGVDSYTNARGQEVFDYNKDGDLDILVGNWGSAPSLFDNRLENIGNWIQIELEGTQSNRNAFGAVLRVKIGENYLHRLNHGANFLGQSIKPIHFGLADNNNIEELTIFWPSGRVEKLYDVGVNQFINVKEGEQEEVLEETYGTIPDELVYEEEISSNKSIARRWNEFLLESIRNDYARPTVHARNLFHISVAMYDAWAVYDSEATPLFLGKTFGDYSFHFENISLPDNIQTAREEAISYASYRLLVHRFQNSPGSIIMLKSYQRFMESLGYDINNNSLDYLNGSPAALGNYIAQQIIEFGLQDGSNEQNDYINNHYQPNNSPLIVDTPGNPSLTNPNSWQPLTLTTFIDQSGNEIPGSTPGFLGPEWGQVIPFALNEEKASIYPRGGYNYKIYNDPGKPVSIQTQGISGLSDPYKWGFSMVSVWSSHLDPGDNVMIDISPGSIGNTKIEEFPKTFEEYKAYYKFYEGGDIGTGHDLNPVTGASYAPQNVSRGDYARVLAEFWADGPKSETPPGHWFTILNYVSDHPLTEKKFSGKGKIVENLEWDVKSYLALSGAMHDAAITAWGIKGYYDYIRPISAIRYMASKGQSTDSSQSNFDLEGLPLIPGYIEIISEEDELAGENKEYVGEIKLYAWKGNHFIDNPATDVAGVGWIKAMDWVPYQRPSFVTPPFAGYVSGHSTFSRAAAEVLTQLTGSNFFPGGMGSFNVKKNAFLIFEDGPSTDITLQWATYQDASDQTSLSRIWGGIHPPIDDIPGRLLGETIGKDAFELSESFFYKDMDADGYYSYEDADDTNSEVHEEQPKTNNAPQHILYPVPVNDIMTFNLQYEGKITINIFTIYGVRVLQKEVLMQNNNSSININNLATGVYLVVFTDENKENTFSKKIIKQ